MSQVAKIDPSSATFREIHFANQNILKGINQTEIKIDKVNYSLYPFGQLINFYIPRGIEMRDAHGNVSLDNWGLAHFLTHAEYFEEQGFKKGKYPYQDHWCPHRNEYAKATMDVTGRPVTVDDPTFIEMVKALKAFPPKGYRDANNRIIEFIFKDTIEGVVNIDPREPFGALIVFQQVDTWNLTKIAHDCIEQIRNLRLRIENYPISNRSDVAKLQKEAIFVLLMEEL